jgi:hypothetical protein
VARTGIVTGGLIKLDRVEQLATANNVARSNVHFAAEDNLIIGFLSKNPEKY